MACGCAVFLICPCWFYYRLYSKSGLLKPSQIYLLVRRAAGLSVTQCQSCASTCSVCAHEQILIICIGVVGSVVGMYYAIKDLTDDIEQNPNPFDGFFS
jgi:hypothetical protein